MWVSSFILFLAISLGEAGYNNYGPSSFTPSTGRQRAINDDDFRAFDTAVPKIRAQYGSQRPSYSNPYSGAMTAGIEFGRLGGLSNDALKQRMDELLAKYPGATYSMGGRDGAIIQGKIPKTGSYPNNFQPQSSQSYSTQPQSAASSYSRPAFNYKKPPLSPPSSYEPKPVQDSPTSNFGTYQGLGQSNNYSPQPQPQVNDYSQSPQPSIPSRDPTYGRVPPSRFPQSYAAEPESQPQRVPGNSYNAPPPAYQQSSEPAGGFGDNPVASFLGGGQGLVKGGPHVQLQAHEYQPTSQDQGSLGTNNDVSSPDPLFGGGQTTPSASTPKPVSTFNPTDGFEAAENLASAISGALDYHWKTKGNIRGSADFFLDLCEKAVSNQQPAMEAMKKSDRTLMDIMPIWRKSLAKKLSSFFITSVRDSSYAVGSEKIDSIMVLMGECVRPKLVLTRI